MYVIGTAGHVDHGKSTLVHALTGIDPDRLQEEKDRGMTIDLGFAWLRLPSGREISIVDVPGHERFIKNMLAGVGGIDVAMLVVAADEGPMPQTDEHLAILDLLGISRGVVAITKSDLVDEEWLELVKAETEERLAPTSLAHAALVPVSAVTGAGLEDLLTALDGLLSEIPAKRDIAKPRIPVDRIFSVSGFGTVVTGTLIDGQLKVGQEVELLPSGKRTRVRGIQSHKRKVEAASPGTRVAVNLASIGTEEISRGDVVTAPGWLRPTKVIDVRLRAIPAAPKPLEHGDELTFHTGAAESVAKLALLDIEALLPGETGWAQLRLVEPVAVAKGDQFIVRVPSPSYTAGGGVVVDPHPKRHRRFQQQVAASLATMERGTPEEIVLQQMPAAVPIDAGTLSRKAGLPLDQTLATLEAAIASGSAIHLDGAKTDSRVAALNSQSLVMSSSAWAALRERIENMLRSHHREYPFRRGMPREEGRSRCGLDARGFSRVEARLLSEGAIEEYGPLMAIAGHVVSFSVEVQQKTEALLASLRDAGASPPGTSELLNRYGLDNEVLAALLDQGSLVEIAPDIVLEKSAYEDTVARIVEAVKQHGSITVAAVRDLFGTSRKYALALMEHLDEKKITRRVGDERVLN
ncbi:MAG TPA: selenocysteine-specific translation elongation factor [Chloroflexota bacterium]